MRRVSAVVLFVCALSVVLAPGVARCDERKTRIEVLQVTDIEPYRRSLQGFLGELASSGFVAGRNLEVRRKVIGFDMERANLWSKIAVLMQIKSEAMRIADEKPDLVLTIGTPSTKFAKDKIIQAGIPLVFTAVAIPTAAGCTSLTHAGQGFTGATLYMDMKEALRLVKQAFPGLTTIGMVHSDDENGVAHVEEAKKTAPTMGMRVLSRQVDKNSPLTPVLEELRAEGVEAFAVPLDTYYGMRDYRACRELESFSLARKIPVFSFAMMKVPGAILYVGSDFQEVGALSGQLAAKIIRKEADPDTLPVARQEDLRVLVDPNMLEKLGWKLPQEILQIAQSVY
ncbi:MAG TPA: ABC transporter substrate binding protein [Deltaproteobacteria bacterium]|nr:ABC transporter substrate binding protein [Deltaproteobacteria bacterium]HPP81678.1 ABC transporter substrate binding protein [Deltaproteobacteria bacterium]